MITRFMDMHSGGGCKTDWEYILIEAPEDKARAYFERRFGRDPSNVTCPCCGGDYSIQEYDDLQEATAYDRNCDYDDDGYKERARPGYGEHQTVKQYLQRPEVLFIPASEVR